jgi:diguanylate cyclase (GGDEF)-like protein
MQQMPDGTPIPAEVTLVRVNHKNDYIVAGYTRDLRVIKDLEEKAEEVYYDTLTGIFSRRYLDEKLTETIKNLSRSRGYLSLMMIDVDHFKKYNDLYGHTDGDSCLKRVAEILSKNITRETDFAARFGGEEFTIVLPYTDEDGAKKLAERLVKNIRAAKIPHGDNEVSPFVTISIGVATGKVSYDQSGDDYIKRADEMLYISKEAGRDRFTSAMI